MTHLTLPSEVEPESLADLVADCASVASTVPAAPPVSGPHRPAPGHGVRIPESTAALLEGMPEYGD